MRLPQPVRRAISVWVGVPNVPAARRWALVAVVDAIGTGMFLPVSVLYFTVVVGLRTELAGLGLGIAGLLGAIASPIAGTLVDRFGAKAMVAGCLLLAVAGYGGSRRVRGPGHRCARRDRRRGHQTLWVPAVLPGCGSRPSLHSGRSDVPGARRP